MTELAAEGAAGDTIFALASGAGRGAVSVLRLSGPRTLRHIAALAGDIPPQRRASLRHLRDGSGAVLDQALVLCFPGPGSFTGEDCAELHLHGGRAVLEAVSAALLTLGARPAAPGEFSKRAFIRGKLDLLEAEAIADLVAAETEAQRRQAIRQLGGAQSAVLAGWRTRLRGILAHQEALIDFPDEDLPPDVEAQLLADTAALAAEIEAEIIAATAGIRLRQGLVFTIAGPPNVGKSSLLNALLARDAAIVSPAAGTTRDALEMPVELGGVPVTLIDTAGLRETTNPIEAEGVRRARARAASADLVIDLCTANDFLPAQLSAGERLLVANKCDLAPAPPGRLAVSALTGAGIPELRNALAARARDMTQAGAHPAMTRARHAAALRDGAKNLRASLVAPAVELRAEELRLAMAALGRITGAVEAESLLDTIFGEFCIGK